MMDESQIPEVPPDRLREAVLAVVRGGGPGTPGDFMRTIDRQLGGDGGHGEKPRKVFPARQYGQAMDIVWELAIQGYVRLGAHQVDSSGERYEQRFVVTANGKRWLNEEAVLPLPQEAELYVKRILDEAPGLDPVAVDYAGEALRAYSSKCYKSAAVMLGCASETLIICLLQAFLKYPQADQKKTAQLAKALETQNITQKHDILMKRLKEDVESQLDPGLRDNMKFWLESFFDALRRCRNEAGHPTGVSTNAYEMMAMLQIFPRYARKLWDLHDWFLAAAS